MTNWRDLTSYLTRPRYSEENIIRQVQEKFPSITETEIKTFLSGEKDLESARKLDFYKREYDAFQKRNEAVMELADLFKSHYRPLDVPMQTIRPSNDEVYSEESVVMMNSDQHIGMNVTEREAPKHIPNSTYNVEVARNRIRAYTKTFLDIVNEKRKTRNIEHAVIVYAGDTLEGGWEFLNHNKDYVTDQYMEGMHIVGEQIASLSANFKHIDVIVQPGNHGRIDKKYPTFENMEYTFFKTCVEPRFVDFPNVTMKVSSHKYNDFSVYNHNFVVIHGDGIKMHFKTPFYGIETRNDSLHAILSQHGLGFKYLLMGHFHEPASLPSKNGKVMMCGSTTGFTPYSFEKMARYCEPSQKMFGVHAERGKTWEYDINLEAVR